MPYLLSYGLVKASPIDTEACTVLAMRAVDLGVYGGYALLTPAALATGTLVGHPQEAADQAGPQPEHDKLVLLLVNL